MSDKQGVDIGNGRTLSDRVPLSLRTKTMDDTQTLKEKIIIECNTWSVEHLLEQMNEFEAQAKAQGAEEAGERIIKRIGSLRQWINERSKTYLVQNEDIQHWLNLSHQSEGEDV